ncbi:MAG: hypothetical protein P8174_00005, partial [Gemmatimonadota bacterium]
MTVLGTGLGSVGAATVFAMRSTNDALLQERAVVLAVATLDSLSALPAPANGALQVPGIEVSWVVDADTSGGEIRLSATSTGSWRHVSHFRARFLTPVPAVVP